MLGYLRCLTLESMHLYGIGQNGEETCANVQLPLGRPSLVLKRPVSSEPASFSGALSDWPRRRLAPRLVSGRSRRHGPIVLLRDGKRHGRIDARAPPLSAAAELIPVAGGRLRWTMPVREEDWTPVQDEVGPGATRHPWIPRPRADCSAL